MVQISFTEAVVGLIVKIITSGQFARCLNLSGIRELHSVTVVAQFHSCSMHWLNVAFAGLAFK